MTGAGIFPIRESVNPGFLKAAKHYLAGFIASSFNGGIGAVSAILSVDGASISGLAPQARVLNGHEMISCFVGACTLHGFLWLKAHPLPENYDTSAPFFPAPKATDPNKPPSIIPDLPKT